MGLHVPTLLSRLQALVYQIQGLKMTQQSRNVQPHYHIICLILPLLCLTELHPPFISQTLRDGTPQVQTVLVLIHLRISYRNSLLVFFNLRSDTGNNHDDDDGDDNSEKTNWIMCAVEEYSIADAIGSNPFHNGSCLRYSVLYCYVQLETLL